MLHLCRRPFMACFLVLLLASGSMAAEKPSRVLFVTQSEGFVHPVVRRAPPADKDANPEAPAEGKKEDPAAPQLSVAEIALTQLGEKTGLFKVDCTQDCEADFTEENLKNYDIVAFYTTGNLPIAPKDLTYFFGEWLKQPGHGVLGFHSAMDTYHEYEPYWDMIGGTFINHPWTAGSTVTLANHDPNNPLVQPFGSDFTIKDEIYMYRHWQPSKVRVLLSLDYAKSPTKNPVPTEHGYHVPVCWIKQYGEGRVYCNNLGHNATSWTNPAYLDSITQAVRWIRRDIDVEATPNPNVSAEFEEKSKKDFQEHGFSKKDLPKPKAKD